MSSTHSFYLKAILNKHQQLFSQETTDIVHATQLINSLMLFVIEANFEKIRFLRAYFLL